MTLSNSLASSSRASSASLSSLASSAAMVAMMVERMEGVRLKVLVWMTPDRTLTHPVAGAVADLAILVPTCRVSTRRDDLYEVRTGELEEREAWSQTHRRLQKLP